MLINIISVSHNVSKSYFGNIWHVLVQKKIQQEALYSLFGTFWKMAATAARGQFGNGSTPKFVHYILIYLCAKIGAFIKKCTID